ncbi:hypothetical protein NQD34_011773 [Periophthalmus magnuspinnatus]|nr:hypothetical protein NQD34_011773 [Periophthalmus magnuspinnatus]
MVRFGAFFHLFLLLTLKNADTAENMTKPQTNHRTREVINSTTNLTVNPSTGNDKLNNSVTENQNNSSVGSEKSAHMLDLLMESVQDLKVIIAFGTGVVLTTIICGLTQLCCRVKRRNSLNVSDTLEMVSTKALKVNEQQEEATQTHGGGAEEADGPSCKPEVEYSDIDFAALRKRGPEGDKTQETAENEYAEIKREMTETEPSQEEEQEGEEGGGEEGGGEERGGEGEEREEKRAG